VEKKMGSREEIGLMIFDLEEDWTKTTQAHCGDHRQPDHHPLDGFV